MKKFFIVNVLIIILISGFSLVPKSVIAQNRYSIEQKSKKTKHHLTSEQRYEDRIVKKTIKKKRNTADRNKKRHKRNLKKYNKNVSGGGKEIANNKKVYRRMKKSKKEAKANSSRKKSIWKRITQKKS
jgi:hypothetical protein